MLMCKKCKSLNSSFMFTEELVDFTCTKCGGVATDVDEEFIPHIKRLWDKGYGVHSFSPGHTYTSHRTAEMYADGDITTTCDNKDVIDFNIFIRINLPEYDQLTEWITRTYFNPIADIHLDTEENFLKVRNFKSMPDYIKWLKETEHTIIPNEEEFISELYHPDTLIITPSNDTFQIINSRLTYEGLFDAYSTLCDIRGSMFDIVSKLPKI